MIQIAPSMICADLGNLREEVKKLSNAGADMLHFDVMDGHFVRNFAFGADTIATLRKETDIPFDIHFLCDNPEEFIDMFAAAGADIITVHAEVSPHLNRIIDTIKGKGLKASVALNPATPIQVLDIVLDKLDMVVIMTINPGRNYRRQQIIPQAVEKMRRLSQQIQEEGLRCKIQVDGGVKEDNVSLLIEAGADIIIAGSAIFSSGLPYKEAIDRLRG